MNSTNAAIENNQNNVTTLPCTPKPQTSKEVIAANVKLLIEQLEAGHSEGLTAYLTAMGRFHNYSFGNILEIARQKPDATRVAGLYAWNQLGRKISKGQKGIRILAPMIGSRKKKDTEATSKDPAAVNKPVLVGFRAVYVFDVSQTEGAELPAFTERTRGDVGEYRERLIDFTIAGLDAGRASADYIHLYHGNAALLTESLEVIQRTAGLILSAIETEQVQAEATPTTEGTGTDAALAEVA